MPVIWATRSVGAHLLLSKASEYSAGTRSVLRGYSEGTQSESDSTWSCSMPSSVLLLLGRCCTVLSLVAARSLLATPATADSKCQLQQCSRARAGAPELAWEGTRENVGGNERKREERERQRGREGESAAGAYIFVFVSRLFVALSQLAHREAQLPLVSQRAATPCARFGLEQRYAVEQHPVAKVLIPIPVGGAGACAIIDRACVLLQARDASPAS